MLLPELFRDDVLRLETKRLWLRWPRAADARALHRLASRAEVAEKTATWPHPLPEQEVDRRIIQARELNAHGTALVLAILRKKEPDRLIGIVGFHAEPRDGNGLVLGFMLEPELHKRGFMTEAVRAGIDAILAVAPYARIHGACQRDNIASRRVFEKTGFTHVGESWRTAPARSAQQACHDFELTRAAWLSEEAARRRASQLAAREARAA